MTAEYKHDVFYKTSHLNVKDKKDLLQEAKEKSTNWWIDILDCSKSWSKQKIAMSFKKIISKFNSNCRFVFIHRRGFKGLRGEYLLETGFTTMGDPSYFLWIHLDEEQLEHFIEKYNLTNV